ncbi:MAG TPA: hypothetical protein VMU94_19115 [Streptosporangiaceae bacterium]|nr:hypothetical protein [Streptosporangiaceae bacterium]
MQLAIRDDDEAGFEQAKDWLLDGFGRWLGNAPRLSQEAADAAVSDASIALDWKFGYGDGHLGRWTASEITEFLLGWCPRKLSVPQDDCAAIPGHIALFTDYLAAQRLLAPGSAAAAALRAAATDAAADFIAEMGNPARFGMAKALFAGAAEYGHDVTDEAGLAAWMERFNSLRDEERNAILPDSVLGGGGPAAAPRRRSLPLVVLPPDEVIEASKAAAPILGMLAKLAGFGGAGRPLTPNGNLTLADARELVTLLGTGDVMDPKIGDRVFRTRSSAELPRLRLVFTWAKKAGVVRVLRGKVVATRRGLALADDPAGMFDKAWDALLSVGPIGAQTRPDAWARWPDVDQVIDSIAVHLLIPAYMAGGPVPLADITDLATHAMTSAFEFGQTPDEYVTRHIAWDVAMLADAMELAGVLRRVGAPGDDAELNLVRPGGDVELTPAGLAALRSRLATAGYDTPVAGRLAAVSATGLVTGIDPADSLSSAAEVDAWLQRRTPEQALTELADAARQISNLELQNIALAIMTDIGPEAAAPHIRRLADDRVARGAALCWLADHGLLAERELYDHGELETFCDVLANRLLTAELAGLAGSLALAGDKAAQARLVSELGGSPAASAEPVLEAIGRNHPAKAVAKAARKALFQRRSRLAGP